MTLEVRIARGIRLWIDGYQPSGSWEVANDSEDRYLTEQTVRGKRGPLRVGRHTIASFKFDVPKDEWSTRLPKEIEAQIDGRDVKFQVVAATWGTEEKAAVVEMKNGTIEELDEITAYVRGEAE